MQGEQDAILEMTAAGKSAHPIGPTLGQNPAYIRHIHRQAAGGIIHASQTEDPLAEDRIPSISKERHPGIPLEIPSRP